MRRELLVPIAILVLDVGMADAGIVTNANQSAAFVRMPARNATLGIDGVYYNPAGLTKLSDGWHFSLYNQSAFRDREVETDYANLSDAPSSAFPADAQSALSPGLYAVYKVNRLASIASPASATLISVGGFPPLKRSSPISSLRCKRATG
jgi:hypothetical protein